MKSGYPVRYFLPRLLTLRGWGLGFSDPAIGLMQSGYPVGSTIGWSDSPARITAVTAVAMSANLTPEATTLYPDACTQDGLGVDK